MLVHLSLGLLVARLAAAATSCSTVTSTKTGATVTVTKTPTATVHPSTHTNTVVRQGTTTVASSNAPTVTVTSTKYTGTSVTAIGSVSTSTHVISVISTVYVASTTTTIPTSPGFTPLKAEVSAGGNTPQKRDVDDEALVRPRAAAATTTACTTTVVVPATRTITSTATKTSTVTGSTPQVTKTTTSFVTKTASGAVTKTVTVSTGSVSTSYFVEGTNTVTVQSHGTTTTHVAVATVYAACNDDNQLRGVNGIGIPEAIHAGPDQYNDQVPAANAYDCCVQSLKGNYAGSYFVLDPSGTGDTNCLLSKNRAANGVCSFNGTVNQFQTQADSDHNAVLSNGNCGNYVYAGVFGFS